MSQQNKKLRIEAIKLAIEILEDRLAKIETDSDALARGEVPYKVPPEGCKEGWYDNGHGYCVVNS